MKEKKSEELNRLRKHSEKTQQRINKILNGQILEDKISNAGQICFECGFKYGFIPFPTHCFGIWTGQCDICGKNEGLESGVTAPRDFGYLHTWENIEEWKDIIGYEGKYQVSSMGRIKAISYRRSGKEKILVNKKVKSARYYTICLTKNNKQQYLYVHRLVAQAFIPNSENKPQVNHKNGKKVDNRVENLEWNTASENETHAYRVLKKISPITGKFGILNKLSKPLLQYDLNGVFIKKWDCAMDVKRELKISVSHLAGHIKGNSKHVGGFKWKYADK